jgi:hypothetical protein
MRLQRRLGCLARQWGLKFSILGDDITFSGSTITEDFVARVKSIIRDEGFKIHATKGGVFTKSERQMVTGINVAHGLSVQKEKRAWDRELYIKQQQLSDGQVSADELEIARKTHDGRMSYFHSVRKKNLTRY